MSEPPDPDAPRGGAPGDRPRHGGPGPEGDAGPGGPPPFPYGPGGPASDEPDGPARQRGPGGSRRPPQVVVAAVLGFVIALFLLLSAFAFLALSSVTGLFAVVAVLYLALATLAVWGGLFALQGRGDGLLKVTGAVTVALSLLALVAAFAQGTFDVASLLTLGIGAAVLVLLNAPASRRFFRADGPR